MSIKERNPDLPLDAYKWTLKNGTHELPFGTFTHQEVVEGIESGSIDFVSVWARPEVCEENGYIEIGAWTLLFQLEDFREELSVILEVMDLDDGLEDPDYEADFQGLDLESSQKSEPKAA